jgi:polysaccharide biosynthesis/export protein
MAGGPQRGLRSAWGLLAALCLAGLGCRSTPIGQALYGSNTETASAPQRFVLVAKRTPDAVASNASPVVARSGDRRLTTNAQDHDATGTPEQRALEHIAWRSAPDQGNAQSTPIASAPPSDDKAAVTPIAYRAQETPSDFPAAAPDLDNPAPAPDTLHAPQPLPGPPIPMDALPPGVGVPMVSGPVHGPGPGPAPHELNMMSLPPYTVEPPDILLIESSRGLPTQPVRGQHLVRPDGTINLGIYGEVYVTGMTLDQIKAQVARAIASRLDKDVVAKNPVKPEDVSVDVLAYNSKVYYVIMEGGGVYGEQVYRLPVTGNERVLDALAQIPSNGLTVVSSKKHIWVARRVPGHGSHDEILPVDWCGITQRGEAATNYQILPGDRVYVKAQKLITIDTMLAKILSPVQRILGVTLLGSETVNSIRNRGTGSSTP